MLTIMWREIFWIKPCGRKALGSSGGLEFVVFGLSSTSPIFSWLMIPSFMVGQEETFLFYFNANWIISFFESIFELKINTRKS